MTTHSSFRLPSNVRPICYHITLTPDLDEFSFAGEEWVEIDILEPLSEIVLNATELEVPTANLELSNGDIIEVAEIDGTTIGWGITSYASDDVELIKGKNSKSLPGLLSHYYGAEVVHRNNMALP